MSSGSRWLVAVLAALGCFGGCWAGLAVGRVLDTGSQIGIAAVPLTIVLAVLGARAERPPEKRPGASGLGNRRNLDHQAPLLSDVGNAEAMRNLGVLLDEQGNKTEAEQWLRKAANTGDDWAMRNLGVLLDERGNKTEAEQWLRKAANAGNADAMRNLGVLLDEQGNKTEAEQWLRKAANSGNEQ